MLEEIKVGDYVRSINKMIVGYAIRIFEAEEVTSCTERGCKYPYWYHYCKNRTTILPAGEASYMTLCCYNYQAMTKEEIFIYLIHSKEALVEFIKLNN